MVWGSALKLQAESWRLLQSCSLHFSQSFLLKVPEPVPPVWLPPHAACLGCPRCFGIKDSRVLLSVPAWLPLPLPSSRYKTQTKTTATRPPLKPQWWAGPLTCSCSGWKCVGSCRAAWVPFRLRQFCSAPSSCWSFSINRS